MYRLTISDVASEDIHFIDSYYREKSPKRANQFLIDLLTKVERIEENPRQYQYSDKSRHIRRAFLNTFPYTIFYHVDPESSEITVLTVVGQAENPEKWPG
jgi:plasmid stabilization system protein ParE